MAGLYPNPSASASNFKIGDKVRWYISENCISPYIGKVTHICPKTNKVWVEFPVGGNQQKDPSELMLANITERSEITEDTGYDSYERIKSERNFGSLSSKKAKLNIKKGDYIRLKPDAEIYLSTSYNKKPPKWAIENEIWVVDDLEELEDGTLSLNVSILGYLGKENPGAFCSWVSSDDVLSVEPKILSSKETKIKKMASKVVSTFMNKVYLKLAQDINYCKELGMKDVQTYQKIYPVYNKICSDRYIRFVISEIYKRREM